MRYTLITPIDATRWGNGADHPLVSPMRKDRWHEATPSRGRNVTDTGEWAVCGGCGKTYEGHGILVGTGVSPTVCPGDWVVTSDRGTEIVSHGRFTSTYAPVRWVKRDFFREVPEPVEAVQWNGPGDVEGIRPATPDDLPDGCGMFSCRAPYAVGRHGVTVGKGIMGSIVCPGDWFVTFPERSEGHWSDEHWSDRAFRDDFTQIVDTGAWEREGEEKS